MTGQRALCRRIRALLDAQKMCFTRYIELARQGRSAIELRQMSRIAAYVSEEGSIVRRLAELQKVIESMQTIADWTLEPPADSDDALTELRRLEAEVDDLRSQALGELSRNREALAERAESLRRELSGLRIPRNKRSVFHGQAPSYIDIRH